MDFERIRKRITFKLINRKNTVYDLDDIPHTDFLDLSFIYFIVIYMDDAGADTVVIRNEYLDRWGISDTRLHEISKENFRTFFSIEIITPGISENFLMVTTRSRLFGAVYMADNDILSTAADIFCDDLCIIPSSIHEIILIPAAGIEKDEIDEVIKSVNEEAVAADEYLSDHMYLFLRSERTIIY